MPQPSPATEGPRGRRKGKRDEAISPSETASFSFGVTALKELAFLLQRTGVWALLDCGATRSLVGAEVIEHLMYGMMELHGVEFTIEPDTVSFTFGDGQQKRSMGKVSGQAFLGPELQPLRLSTMINMVPIRLGVDVLAGAVGSIVD